MPGIFYQPVLPIINTTDAIQSNKDIKINDPTPTLILKDNDHDKDVVNYIAYLQLQDKDGDEAGVIGCQDDTSNDFVINNTQAGGYLKCLLGTEEHLRMTSGSFQFNPDGEDIDCKLSTDNSYMLFDAGEDRLGWGKTPSVFMDFRSKAAQNCYIQLENLGDVPIGHLLKRNESLGSYNITWKNYIPSTSKELRWHDGSGDVMKLDETGELFIDKITVNSAGVFTFNNSESDVDFQIKSDTESIFYVDAGNNKIGVGNDAPLTRFEIRGYPFSNSQSYPYQNSIIDTETAYNTTSPFSPGGGIAFGGIYNVGGSITNFFAGIQGYKENNTDDDFAGALGFYTRANGGVTEKNASLSSTGIFKAKGYQSSDGSAGVTGSFVDNGGNTVTVKNGLITSLS